MGEISTIALALVLDRVLNPKSENAMVATTVVTPNLYDHQCAGTVGEKPGRHAV